MSYRNTKISAIAILLSNQCNLRSQTFGDEFWFTIWAAKERELDWGHSYKE